MEAAKASCKYGPAWKLQERVVNRGLHGSFKSELLTVVCMEAFGITLLTMEFLLRLLRASEGCLGCENGKKKETEAASTRNESETNEPNTNRKRIQNATKTEPKCTRNQAKTDPKPAQRIQDDPKRPKLAQVGPSVDPKMAHDHPKTAPRGISKLAFSLGKTTIWAKRAILGFNRMKALQKQTYQFYLGFLIKIAHRGGLDSC